MRLRSAALSMCIVVITLSGCASLGTPRSEMKAELSKSAGPATQPAGGTKVDIIYQPERGQPERLERALTEPTTVQQLLVQSGSIKRYRRFEVEVIRPLPNG